MTGGPQGQVPGQENCPGAATASAASSGAYVTNNTTSGPGIPGQEERDAELARLLNADRLATYLQACHGNQDEVLRLYAWNIEVASAFWGSFNVFEVALRNVIHSELSTFAGQEDWWNAQIGLHQFEQQRVKDAISAARRAKGSAVVPGHVVAELSLGFWTGLLANRYHQRLWVPALHAAFPHLIGTRRALHREHESLRKLRNRIAHHEPIFARDLSADHGRLLDSLGAISLVAVDWVKQNSRVPLIISRRDDVVNGTESTTF